MVIREKIGRGDSSGGHRFRRIYSLLALSEDKKKKLSIISVDDVIFLSTRVQISNTLFFDKCDSERRLSYVVKRR